jgi:hypothetical protein
MAVVGIGAAAAGVLASSYFGRQIGGALSIGALVAVGFAAIATVAAPLPGLNDRHFRGVVDSAEASTGLTTATPRALRPGGHSCQTCGSSQAAAPAGTPRTVGHAPVAQGYR